MSDLTETWRMKVADNLPCWIDHDGRIYRPDGDWDMTPVYADEELTEVAYWTLGDMRGHAVQLTLIEEHGP